MSSSGPSYLGVSPEVKRSGNKRLLYIIAVILAAMVMIMLLFMSSENTAPKEEAVVVDTKIADKPLTAAIEDLSTFAPEPEVFTKPDDEIDITVVGPPPVDRDAEITQLEQDEVRRRKFEQSQAAFNAPLLIARNDPGMRTASASSTATSSGSGSQAQSLNTATAPNNPSAANIEKEGFLDRTIDNEWVSPHTREAGWPYEIKTGTVIPGVMVSGINSDLPGTLIAQVAQNIYETARGRHLLIPQGSKLYGTYDSRVVYGQERVLVAWNRVVLPDGSSINLGAMPGLDMAGYSGFTDEVDNHYLRIFGSALLMSLITGGTAYAVDSASGSTALGTDTTTLQDEMTSVLADQLGQTSAMMLEKNLSIQPTLEIRPGYQFNVVVTKDVVFESPYK